MMIVGNPFSNVTLAGDIAISDEDSKTLIKMLLMMQFTFQMQ